MSDLPQGWAEAPIGSVCSLNNGRAFKPTEWATDGLPIVRIQNLNNPNAPFNHFRGEFESRYHLSGGELLFAWSGTPGTSFGAHVWRGGEAVLNQHIFRVDFDEATLDKRFFRYAINQKLDDLIDIAHGGVGLRHVTKGTFERTLVAVPPFNEQKRIADKLDAVLAQVDSCRERLDHVPAILKRFRQAVLVSATCRKLTEEWWEMHDASNPAMSHWQDVTLGDLCENSFYGPRFGKGEYTQSNAGIPTIRTTDMTRDGRIEITEDTPKVVVPKDKLAHFRVQKGDLLVTRTGSIGVMAVFEDDYLAIPSAYLIRFRFSPEVLSRYVFYCLMAPAGQERLGLSATAITQLNVNAEAIKRIAVQLPPVEEQREIVRRVEALFAYADRLEARYAAARAQVERLTPALLAKAFRGELVPQDPNDEPASVLLERIRASRAAAGEKPPRKVRTERKPMTTTLTTDILKEIIHGLPTDQFTFDDLCRQVATDHETLEDVVFALLSETPASIKQVFDAESQTMQLVRVKR